MTIRTAYVVHPDDTDALDAFEVGPRQWHDTEREALAAALGYDQAIRWTVSSVVYRVDRQVSGLGVRELVDALKVEGQS